MTTTIDIDTIVEIAPGADESQSPATWPWVDITSRTTTGSRTQIFDQSLSIRWGRSAESSRTQPSQFSARIWDPDAALDPFNPESPWFGTLARGTPCRVTVLDAGVTPPSFLSMLGSGRGASTPDAAGLDVAGNLDVRVEARHLSWRSPEVLASKWDDAAGATSWRFTLDSVGHLVFAWNDGSTTNTVESTVVLAAGKTTRAVRAALDIDDGAGNHTVDFYTAATISGPWTQLGATVTSTGTTTVAASAADLHVGALASEETTPTVGSWSDRIAAMELRDGASVVASPDFTGVALDSTSFIDTQSNTWTVADDALVTHRGVRLVGSVAAFERAFEAQNLEGNEFTTLTVAGPLRRIIANGAGAQQGPSPLRAEITSAEHASNIIAYWPCEDGASADSASSPIPSVDDLVVSGGIEFAADDTLETSRPLPHGPDNGPVDWHADLPTLFADVTYTVSTVAQIPVLPTTGPVEIVRVILPHGSNLEVQSLVAGIDDTVGLFVARRDGANPQDRSSFNGAANLDGKWSLWTLNYNHSGLNINYELRVRAEDDATVYGGTGSVTQLNVAPPVAVDVENAGAGVVSQGLSFGHIVVGQNLPIDWLDTAFRPTAETALHRFRRVATAAGITARTLADPGDLGDVELSEPMGPPKAAVALDVLRSCAAVDGGILSELRRRPGLAYRPRLSLHSQDPAITLDYTEAHARVHPILDDQRFRTDVTVRSEGGASASAVDQSLPRHEFVVTLNTVAGSSLDLTGASAALALRADNQLAQIANWLLHLGTWPDFRHPQVTVDLAFNQSLVDEAQDLAAGDLVRITGIPGTFADLDLLVVGADERWSGFSWSPVLNCIPAGPYVVGELDDDTLGRLAPSDTQLTNDITSTATSISVTTVSGPVWIDSIGFAGEFPFDIDVGGEHMTVTAVSSTTSPQTFTVTRSANGVVKAHSSGDAVTLAQPLVLAL